MWGLLWVVSYWPLPSHVLCVVIARRDRLAKAKKLVSLHQGPSSRPSHPPGVLVLQWLRQNIPNGDVYRCHLQGLRSRVPRHFPPFHLDSHPEGRTLLGLRSGYAPLHPLGPYHRLGVICPLMRSHCPRRVL
jgi:hypothetical protein